MGTIIQISISTSKAQVDALDAIDRAFEKFGHVIKKFSRFNPESELSKLNRSQGEWFKASPQLYTLAEKSLEVAKETGYVFDPTIIDLLKAYGYDSSFDVSKIEQKINSQELKKQIEKLLKNRPHIKNLEMDKEGQKIKLQKKQQIDLGASAKGYAIDLSRDSLLEDGYNDFLINAGGDVWANSTKKVALFDPRTPDKPLGMIAINNKALAGSGSFAKKAGIFHHLIHPKFGKPENKALQTYVIAPSALEADIYSSALFLLGKEGLDIVRQRGYQAIIITEKKVHGDTNLLN